MNEYLGGLVGCSRDSGWTRGASHRRAPGVVAIPCERRTDGESVRTEDPPSGWDDTADGDSARTAAAGGYAGRPYGPASGCGEKRGELCPSGAGDGDRAPTGDGERQTSGCRACPMPGKVGTGGDGDRIAACGCTYDATGGGENARTRGFRSARPAADGDGARVAAAGSFGATTRAPMPTRGVGCGDRGCTPCGPFIGPGECHPGTWRVNRPGTGGESSPGSNRYKATLDLVPALPLKRADSGAEGTCACNDPTAVFERGTRGSSALTREAEASSGCRLVELGVAASPFPPYGDVDGGGMPRTR